ncbi:MULTISPECIES: 2-hydroxymuconate tautomerase family protein [unclassified Sphingomonas]|uniref:tautomerase family protein n=1 Tax=unclassified Sphingomonas TaxID=196159 RepID=UPI0025D8FE99|nr:MULTISPECIES: 2-hydroxymuconate tautomerase family protein [unclassified Sphingomonas]
MPIMHVFMLEGRTEAQKAAFIAAVTIASQQTVDATPESVRVMITDLPAHNFGIAGQTAKQKGRGR